MKGIGSAVVVALFVAGCSGSPDVADPRVDCSKLPLRHEAVATRDAAIDQAVVDLEVDLAEHQRTVSVDYLVRPDGSPWLVRSPTDVDDDGLRVEIERLPIDWAAESLLLAAPAVVNGTARFAIRDATLEIHQATEHACLEPAQAPTGMVGAIPGFPAWRAFRLPKAVERVRIVEHPASYRIPRHDTEGTCGIVQADPSSRLGWHAVLRVEGGFRMWAEVYRDGCFGSRSTCADLVVADSADGIEWDLDPASNPHLEFEGGPSPSDWWDTPAIIRDDAGGYRMFHFYLSELHSSRSEDGVRWVGEGKVLDPLRSASGELLRVSALGALRHDGAIRLWIEAAETFGGVSRIYLARSDDEGLTWTLEGDGPVLSEGVPGSFDELGVGAPRPLVRDGTFVLVYTARNGGGDPRAPIYPVLAVAESEDGVHWTKRDRPLPIPDTASAYATLGSPVDCGRCGGAARVVVRCARFAPPCDLWPVGDPPQPAT